MQLVKFSVKNFRSITDAHQVSIAQTTILIGRNNEGKSNILKALYFAMNILKRYSKYRNRPMRAMPRRYGEIDEISYSWERDFPINLRQRNGSKQSIFRLYFQLNENEIQEFKSSTKCNLNGTLPLEIKIGQENRVDIKVPKRGRGSETLNRNASKVTAFIAEKIAFNYIPAIRTDKQVLSVIDNMLSQELQVLENDPEYQKALDIIKKLQLPILNKLAHKIKEPLSEFLPNLEDVEIEISETKRRLSLRREFSVVINDGTPTNLEFKGDGVKSLAALALLKDRHLTDCASVIAIEEPESHLHPGAIHQLNEIIKSLAVENQIIITTHNPLFVDRYNVRSNIIVDSGKAQSAKNINSIRNLLGIQASDNLINANYVLVVEGETDKQSLLKILSFLSEKIRKFLSNNMLVIESLRGGSNLAYHLSLMENSLCVFHVLLDHDDAGRNAYKKANEKGLLTPKSLTYTMCKGMRNSEFEDCLEPSIYKDKIYEEFGVNISAHKFCQKKKWSDRMQDLFMEQGKPWDKKIEKHLKTLVSQAVVNNLSNCLNSNRRDSIDALAEAVESMLKD